MSQTTVEHPKCQNAEPGTFNHECGKPAVWIGTKSNGFEASFCDKCKNHGWEACGFFRWRLIEVNA